MNKNNQCNIKDGRTIARQCKIYLEQIKDLNKEIDRLNKMHSDTVEYVKAVGGNLNKLQQNTEYKNQIIAKLKGYQKEYAEKYNKNIEYIDKLKLVIAELEKKTARKIFYEKYVNGLTNAETALKLNYNMEYVRKLHAKYINEFRERLKCAGLL